MSNHGMVACGRDLEAAFENCVNLEENGKRYLSDIVRYLDARRIFLAVKIIIDRLTPL